MAIRPHTESVSVLPGGALPFTSRPKTTVRPLRVHYRDVRLNVLASKVVGYRAECDCGWYGNSWDEWREAQAESKWHREYCAEQAPTKGENEDG